MAEQQLLEIGLYFDERTDPATQEHMSLEDISDKLLVYPLHYFRGKHDITLHHPGPGVPGFLVLYNHLVSDPHIDYLQDLKQQGYIKSWAVFPPGTWSEYFKGQQSQQPRGFDAEDLSERVHEDWANEE